MAACNELIIPIKMEPASLPGAIDLHDRASEGLELNPELRILGVLATFYQESGKMSRDVLEKIRGVFGKQVFETIIHAGQSVARAAGEGQPILALSPNDRASEEYNALAKEVIARGK
jgi:chromosome partitioning protein